MKLREVPGESSAEADTATVLIVEDEPKVAEVYEQYLIEDFDVRVANNGAEALVEFGPAVDIVLLDRRMPGMSGDDVLEHLRDWSQDCYVAMVTAVDPESDIVEMPFDDYLTKPVSRDELLTTVEQLLLMDQYEQLLKEYYSVTRKCAAFATTSKEGGPADKLDERRKELLDALHETISSFENEAVTEVFRDLHTVD